MSGRWGHVFLRITDVEAGGQTIASNMFRPETAARVLGVRFGGSVGGLNGVVDAQAVGILPTTCPLRVASLTPLLRPGAPGAFVWSSASLKAR